MYCRNLLWKKGFTFEILTSSSKYTPKLTRSNIDSKRVVAIDSDCLGSLSDPSEIILDMRERDITRSSSIWNRSIPSVEHIILWNEWLNARIELQGCHRYANQRSAWYIHQSVTSNRYNQQHLLTQHNIKRSNESRDLMIRLNKLHTHYSQPIYAVYKLASSCRAVNGYFAFVNLQNIYLLSF